MKTTMKLILILFIFNIILVSNVRGQCIVRGKVTDINGETAIGVPIYLKLNKTSGTVTDYDGNYSLKINETPPQLIVISYMGYKSIEDTIVCNKGATLINNYVLEPESTEIDEVVVTGKERKNNDAQLETYKKLSSITVDFISSETIKKTGDANVASAIARVTGVSTSSGGLITVRGAGDRYIKTTVNGSRIPTLDPFTNNIKLDMFPASLIDNITIFKTARPDLPGDWAGAYISVETKEYPEKLSVNVETSFGYNNQTTFKDIPSSQRSSSDWFGYDNGFREYDHSKYVQFNNKPTVYQEYVALGLGDYLNNMGVIENTPWKEEYTKLGLVELGLLGKAQINDADAVTKALEQYKTLKYKGKAYEIMNARAIQSEKAFPDTWYGTKRKAPLNFSQSFSIGNQTVIFGKPLGYLFGLRYSSAVQYDPNSFGYKSNKPPFEPGNIENDSLNQHVSKETNGWSALLNLACKINRNNSLSFMFMPNLTGVNNVKLTNIYFINDDAKPETKFRTTQLYETRKQLIYQIKSEHFIPGPNIKIEMNASYTNGNSNIPDFKILADDNLDSTGNILNQPNYNASRQIGTGRIFRYLSDNLFDSRISLEIPLNSKPSLVRKVKIGGAYLYDRIQRDQYYYELMYGDVIATEAIMKAFPNVDPYNPDRFDFVTVLNKNSLGGIDTIHNVQNIYLINDSPINHSFGVNTTKSGYILLDYFIIPSVRFSGGLRIEQAFIYSDCNKFFDYNLPATDLRRISKGSVSIGSQAVYPSTFNDLNLLPSANVIIKLNHNESAPINVRLSYSKSVARPNFREISDLKTYDFELNSVVVGNDSLKTAHIKNFDLGFEYYFKSGDNISISTFYKDFENHIEMYQGGDAFFWKNNNLHAWLKGIEIDGRKLIGKSFEFRANITLIDSRSKSSKIEYVEGTPQKVLISNNMLGQAPYIINSMLSYNSKKLGLIASINYNVQGPRLVIIARDATLPDIYELPRHLVDFKISKTLGEHFGVNVKIQDILNSSILRAYKVGDKYPLEYDSYRYGVNYVFAISYKL